MAGETSSKAALPSEIRTERLLLRRWRLSDRSLLAGMNADNQIMEHFPTILSRAESDAMADRIEAHFETHGYGLWAVEVSGVAEFAGFIGLAVPRFEAHFTPCVEVGWRLMTDHWNRGYATEGARAAMEFGYRHLQLDEIVAMTAPDNIRSRRVMEKLEMTHDPRDDFDHPLLPPGHRLRRSVLYRKRRD